jgi:hypothetical protein
MADAIAVHLEGLQEDDRAIQAPTSIAAYLGI